MSPPLLELRKLSVHFALGPRSWTGKPRTMVHAVDDLSLTLERGESLGLVGESGCGKSTVARAIQGLVKPVSGAVLLDGVELGKLRGRAAREARRRVQMLHQDPYSSLDPRRTALESVVEPLSIQGMFKPRERRLRALVLLELVGLDPAQATRFPHEFSGGQRQRIALARALALEPEVLLLDEPTSALDVSVQAQVIELLSDLQRRFGLAYLFISHDLALVRHLCTRVCVMYFGRLVECAPRDELFVTPRHPYTQMLLACAPLADPEFERAREQASITGEAPSSSNPPSGCSFHPRCPRKMNVPGNRCARERPELHNDGVRERACFWIEQT
ncbi:MAG TPA: ABC transporter ATP-binding protein [Planctomycetota bacterium]|nr:ABC transporter ATP-binding protein [Planctomycetota bacterium]